MRKYLAAELCLGFIIVVHAIHTGLLIIMIERQDTLMVITGGVTLYLLTQTWVHLHKWLERNTPEERAQ
jgi:hypothetical protein